MQEEYAIQVKNVYMRFNLARQKVDSLKEYMVKRLKREYIRDEFNAVSDVSFLVEKGDSFAIIGTNGSGKSTLLKMISGIYKPTSGEIVAHGSIAPMIELGAGFDMELTARENVYLNGAVLGHTKDMMSAHFEDIISFAELWDFVDVPIKNFSSGMKARLGFAIATITKPDILIVDEILSVGDANFKEKCEKKMAEMKANGVTLILVSHSIEQVLSVCNRALWINKGRVAAIGDVRTICDAYMTYVTQN
ncbi:ABC transporter ATP-binding protein [Paenibacillus ginsengarvi]|uniref:ABC transporter ATP-binding protein n=1 Tax=Paenibacillus ginsengarvi TaxID=400777 RepID=A0A3B0CB00_9BACL|nr:ABC transporter ATP-binding protein [Paenibacillus ginsengarvi]RKN82190.1 ABC transporter ATP-binding protein [Paenibacillus ginsengarvi]